MAFRRDDEEWNVLVIGTRGETGKALALLGESGRFRTGGYPQVLIGTVARPHGKDDLLAGISDLAAGGERTAGVIDRIIPVEEAVSFPRDDVTETLCELFEPLAPRLCGKTFYVRAHLRGLKGRIEHPAVERALGDFLSEFAARAGAMPKVRFKDPDVVVVVEVVGRRVGYAFVGREHRSHALLKVK
ncbi:MAG: THUMP domain-containing protein [Candidatus Binatia bacterium]